MWQKKKPRKSRKANGYVVDTKWRAAEPIVQGWDRFNWYAKGARALEVIEELKKKIKEAKTTRRADLGIVTIGNKVVKWEWLRTRVGIRMSYTVTESLNEVAWIENNGTSEEERV